VIIPPLLAAPDFLPFTAEKAVEVHVVRSSVAVQEFAKGTLAFEADSFVQCPRSFVVGESFV